MRDDPTYTFWMLRCKNTDQSRQLRDSLQRTFMQNPTVEDVVRVFSSNAQVLPMAQGHRVAEYFEDVRVLPDESPASFRILFHRRPDADRYWKDVMVNILKQASDDCGSEPKLVYRGDK